MFKGDPMKSRKSYLARISGNSGKLCYLNDTLSELQKVSEYVFSEGSELWFDFNEMYRVCRERFPNLKSKLLQNFL